MTNSENLILKGQVVTMSLFRLTHFSARLLVILLAVVAADCAAVQEKVEEEGRLYFKNATLQQHYGRTAGVSLSNYCSLCFVLRCTNCPSEPLETCRAKDIGWPILQSPIAADELRTLFFVFFVL